MRTARRVESVSIVIAFLLAGSLAFAGVFARIDSPEDAVRMWKIHEPQGGVFVVGKIVDRKVLAAEIPELGSVEVTRLEIAVSEFAGQRKAMANTIEASYLGGISYRTSAQPPDGATALGTEGAFFVRPNPNPKIGNSAWTIDGDNAVFPGIRSASGELILIGKSAGSAISKNLRASEFLAVHREAAARVIASEGKK